MIGSIFKVLHLPKVARRMLTIGGAGLVVGSTAGVVYSLSQPLEGSELICHPPKLEWPHKFWFNSLDHASIRRGWEVYKQVCCACHSLKYVAYREMVDVFLTEDEAKAEAAEAMIEDGPDEMGKMYQRPGKLSDYVPSPYPNQEAARAANNGAYPPDLSYIVLAREGYEDYIFWLLTGYADAPAGVTVGEGQYFNPYFPGGAISMAQALYDDVIEYSDGTPATASQLAKDVTTFLAWCSMPEHDERKFMAIKLCIILFPLLAASWYWKRHTWISVKTRKIAYKPNIAPKTPTS